MKTDFETLKALAIYIINYLVDDKLVEFSVERRAQLIDALATELAVGLATDEDIQEQAIEEVEDKLGIESITEKVTETEMYNHARKEIVKSFQGEAIAGLYLVESLHQLGLRIKDFLLKSDDITEVYATDEELVSFLISKIRAFAPKKTLTGTINPGDDN